MIKRHRHTSNRTLTSGRDCVSSGGSSWDIIINMENGIQGKTCNGFLGYNLAMEVSGMNFN